MKLKNIIDDKDFLKQKCIKVDNIDNSIKKLAHDMLDFMYKSSGLGLAAIQVGVLKRLVVIDIQENNEKHPLFLVNPEILEHSSETMESADEGCLSVPGARATIKRFKSVKVKYFDLDGKENIIEAKDDLFCICLQHEIEHLDGIVFIDHLSKQKREFMVKKVYKHLKQGRLNDNK